MKNGTVPDVTIVEYLKLRRFGKRFFYNYLGAVATAIWSGSPQTMAEVPAE
ncbi:MAG: hypothetical protein GY742_12790 [Hyphomicrobiales bacterium]|nr:hypothetical protein [Hyphomicrobiales bacterium]